MGSFMKKAMEAYEQQQVFGKIINAAKITKQRLMDDVEGDSRYNTPKEPPKASEKAIDKAIEETEIYKQAKERILKFQRNQVGYGLDKYPETLNASTWTEIETQHHIIEESIDKLHYEVMRLIQLERKAEKELEEFREKESKHRSDIDSGQFAQYVHDLKKLGLKPIDTKQKEKLNNLKTLYNKQITFATMEDAEKFREQWEAMKAVHDNFIPGLDTDGDVEHVSDDKLAALAYSFGHLIPEGKIPTTFDEKLEQFKNSGKTVNELRKNMGLEPIETEPKQIILKVHLDGKEIAKAIEKYVDEQIQRSITYKGE